MEINSNIFGKILLCISLIFLLVTSFFTPNLESLSGWIPLTAGIIDTDYISGNLWPGLLSAAFIIVIVGYITYTAFIFTDHSFDFIYCIAITAIIILSDYRSLYFNQIFLASFCLILSRRFLINKKLFLASFAYSFSVLFYAPLIWFLPIFLLLLILDSQKYVKEALKILGGFAVPVIYLLSFRYIKFDDVEEFLAKYFAEMININGEFYFTNFVFMFLVIVIAIISIHAISFSIKAVNKNKSLSGYMIKTDTVYLLLTSIIFLLYSRGNGVPLCILVAPFIGILFSFYFSLNISKYSARVEIILFVCAVILARVSYFLQ